MIIGLWVPVTWYSCSMYIKSRHGCLHDSWLLEVTSFSEGTNTVYGVAFCSTHEGCFPFQTGVGPGSLYRAVVLACGLTLMAWTKVAISFMDGEHLVHVQLCIAISNIHQDLKSPFSDNGRSDGARSTKGHRNDRKEWHNYIMRRC